MNNSGLNKDSAVHNCEESHFSYLVLDRKPHKWVMLEAGTSEMLSVIGTASSTRDEEHKWTLYFGACDGTTYDYLFTTAVYISEIVVQAIINS